MTRICRLGNRYIGGRKVDGDIALSRSARSRGGMVGAKY